METEEEKLRLALLATAPGGRQDIPVEAVRHAIQELPESHDTNLVVRRLPPGSFLVIFAAAVEAPDGSTLPAPSSEWAAATEQAPALVVTTEGDVGLIGSSSSMTSSGCPEAEADNVDGPPEACCSELVAFEVQCPTRDEHPTVTTDPMLFESGAPPSKLIKPFPCLRASGGPPLVTPATMFKTYRRRVRSVAAPDPAALPTPVTLNFELDVGPSTGASGDLPGQPSKSEVESEQERILPLDDVGDTTNPLDGEPSPCPTLSNGPKSSRKPNEKLEGRKRTKTQPNRSLEEAKAATANFLASVSQALQVPLASMPARGWGNATSSIPTTPGPRRSQRLANQPLNSMVRPSKKGEALVMHKLGLCQVDGSAPGQPRPQLASVFQGSLDAQTFAAIRDIFPAARTLSDSDLMAAIQEEEAFSACSP
ncbi:unnamed protein product [Urochloa humidicola]